jgi:hypothetical protein
VYRIGIAKAPDCVAQSGPRRNMAWGLFCCLAGIYSCMHFGRVTLCPVQNTPGLDNTMRLLFDVGDKSYCREIVNSWAGKPGKVHSLSNTRWTRGMQPTIACVRTSGPARRVGPQADDAGTTPMNTSWSLLEFRPFECLSN